jgi:lauroyl/myristoyl acyltransferase
MSMLYVLAKGATKLAGCTPSPLRHRLGKIAGIICYWVWRSKRLMTLRNMAQLTGRPVGAAQVACLAQASWANYGRYVADFMAFPHQSLVDFAEHLIDLTADGRATQWRDYFQLARKAGHGVIIATAHFGNWDMAGAFIARHAPLFAVAETFSDRRLNALVQGQREERDIAIIPMERSAWRILRVLQQNEIVALVVDRPVTPNEGVAVNFFGRTTYVPSGPAMLAIKSGAALLPGYVWYGEKQRWYGRFFAPIFPRACTRQEQVQEAQRLTQYIYDCLEVMVREWPTQWYMFRPFWPQQVEAGQR